MEKLLNENELIENRALREQFVNRIEVLEKVKQILTIPGTELSTVKQVAEYYGVYEETIRQIIVRNREELEEDGLTVKSGKKVREELGSYNLSLTNFRGYFTINGVSLSNNKNVLFTRRSVLRMGMFLKNSEVAKEIRTQLLNIEETATLEQKTQAINEEQSLLISVGMAMASGDINALAVASTKLMDFKNRHITRLEQSNKALASGILQWKDRSRINFAVRKLAVYAHVSYAAVWSELYKQLKNNFHIDLQARGKQPWIQHVKEQEWQCVIKCFSALCEYYGQEPSEMFHDLKIQEQDGK